MRRAVAYIKSDFAARYPGMDSLTEFLAMGGHAAYVWPAFAIAFAILIGMAVQAWLQRRRLRRLLEQAQKERTRP